MANIINRQQTFSTNGTVTAAGLHNLIDTALVNSAIIKNQQEITTIGTADLLLIAPDSVDASLAPRKVTVQNLIEDGLTAGTFVNLNLTGALTYGTATGNRTVSTSATITTGTIPNLTAGTTTSTAATITNGTITTALIPTLTAGTTTGTAGIFTSGTVATLNSTTGTITNLSTTLAGDFTITQGTGTIGTGVVTAAKMANPQYTGFRNRIINGDMRIDQRNSGASVNSSSSGSFAVDRFICYGDGGGVYSAQQSSDVPTGKGFNKSIKCTVTSVDSPTGSDYYLISQHIEGYNISDLDFGTANSKTIIVSFWVKSSISGAYTLAIRNNALNRAYRASYTINSTDTWEQKAITISGDTSGTWLTDNGTGFQASFALGAGSSLTGSANNWSSDDDYAATGQTQWISTNGATFYITGVQLEAGSTATEFERRPIGTELALCQRYYEQSTSLTGDAGARGLIAYATTAVQGFYFVVTKRTAPTVVAYSRNGTINKMSSSATGSDTATATAAGITASGIQQISSSGLTTGMQFEANYTASAEL